MVRLEGLFEAETGRILRNAVDDLVRGQRLDESGRTPEQRKADALIELANAFNAGTVTGGRERPQMLVTVDVEQLAKRAGGRALLDTGETITIEAARRLACDADIATVLLRGPSEILDFGRTRRVASNTQYKALVIRDGGCRFPGCDRPPGWTQAHHIVQWPDGGRTDLDNLVLLCLTHHDLIHHQHWRIEGNATNLKIHPPQDGRGRSKLPTARRSRRSWRLATPRVDEQLFEFVDLDRRQPYEHRGEAVVVRLREELLRVRRQEKLLLGSRAPR